MADTKDDKPKKRRLKPAPTVRERAATAQAKANAPEKLGILTRIFKVIWRVISWPFIKFAAFVAPMFKYQPFKFIAKLAGWIGLLLVPRYVRSSFKELKYVTWPGRKQTRDLTTAVLIFALVFGAAIGLVDYGLDKLFKLIFLK
jgi:preprotein translocase SecE subunit